MLVFSLSPSRDAAIREDVESIRFGEPAGRSLILHPGRFPTEKRRDAETQNLLEGKFCVSESLE